jgi:uncharacterized protein YcfJ
MNTMKESSMKKAVLFSAMGVIGLGAASTAGAEEVGRVISSTPVVQQVPVQRQVCNQQPVAVQPRSSGGGAIVGAIVGGLLGNTVGGGVGRAAATGLGAVAGAAVGDSVERNGQYPQQAYAQQCATQTTYENRTVAYNVQYEYAGKQFNVQMPYDPGATIRLNLSPVGGAAPEAAQPLVTQDNTQPPQQVYTQQVYTQQPQAVILAEAPTAVYPSYAYPYPYPAYYAPSYYPPVSLSLGFGYYGGYHHHGGHWRH